MIITCLLITMINLGILALSIKLYTEILKAKHIESRQKS